MRKIFSCFVLSILSAKSLCGQDPTPPKPIQQPVVIEGDEVFIEEELDLEEEELDSFEEI